MADKDSQQRSTSSLFGQSSSTPSIQAVLRERQEASRARRKWLFSWLLPLLAVVILCGVGTAMFLHWKARKKAKAEEAALEKAANDPMRGVTVFGNEDAALKLEFQTPDMMIAPQDLLVVLHRAVGIKPFKVRFDTINLSAKVGDGNSSPQTTIVRINGKSEVEYLDQNGERKTITLQYPEMNQDILISAITLAYNDIYGDDDPDHPFYIKRAEPRENKRKSAIRDEKIELNVDMLNQQ